MAEMWHTHPFRFFLFSFLMAIGLATNERIFNNNFSIGSNLLWVTLLFGVPTGAYAYNRWPDLFKNRLLNLLVSAELFYLFIHAIFSSLNHYKTAIEPSIIAPWLTQILVFEYAAGLFLLMPFWIVCGAFEAHLFSSVAAEAPRTRSLSYVGGLLGLIIGTVAFSFLLPEPSPRGGGLVFAATVFIFGLTFGRTRLPARLANVALAAAFTFPSIFLIEPPFIVYDRWTRHLRLTVTESDGYLMGYYNSTLHWILPVTENSPDFESQLFSALPPDAVVAILGSGGGVQVDAAINLNPRKIFAIDVVPELFTVLPSLGANAYKHPLVRTMAMDGRQFINSNQGPFSMIYLPFSETTLRVAGHLFDPADRLYTIQAMAAYRDRLATSGVIAIKKFRVLSDLGPNLANYAATAQAVGLKTAYLLEKDSFLLLAAPSEVDLEPYVKNLNATVGAPPGGEVLTDNKPFMASQMLSLPGLSPLIYFLALMPFLLALVLWLPTLRKEDFPAVFCGINYSLLLFTAQILIAFEKLNPLNASVFGGLVFLILFTLGTALRSMLWAISALSLGMLMAGYFAVIDLRLASTLVLVLWSGGFFVQLLSSFNGSLGRLFMLDAIGACIGVTAYITISLTFGFTVYLTAVFATFFMTLILWTRALRTTQR